MKKSLAVSIILSLLCLTSVHAQDNEPVQSGDRLYFGGSFAFSIGDYTMIDVSPLVGYKLTSRWRSGVGVTYRYISEFGYDTHVYGGRFFSEYTVYKNAMVHAEYERLSAEYLDRSDGSIKREWTTGVLVGGGWFQPIGEKAGFEMLVLYNLTYDPVRSPYNSPLVVRLGFSRF